MNNKNRSCPKCGKRLKIHETRCECGHFEKLDDDELWRRIKYFGKSGDVAIIAVVLGVIVFIAPLLLFQGSPLMALSVVGFALAFLGVVWFSSLHKRQTGLINDQLVDFFNDEYIRIFGTFKQHTDTGAFRDEVHNSRLFPDASCSIARQVTEGNYKGMYYLAGNLNLWRLEERITEDNKGERKTETVRVDVFGGIWIKVRQSKKVSSPVYVRERNQKRSGKYDEKSLCGNIELENEAFNEKYAISSDSQQDAFYVLTPQLMEQLEALDARAEGKTSVAFVGNDVHFALDTKYKFIDIADAFAGSINSVADIRNVYSSNLQYTADILDIIGHNSFVEREESAVSSVK